MVFYIVICNRINLRGPGSKTDSLLYGSTQSLTIRKLKFLTRYITVFFSGLALWQDGGPNCREDAYGQPRLRPEDAVPLHSWGSGHAVPLQVPLRELLVHQVSFVLHVRPHTREKCSKISDRPKVRPLILKKVHFSCNKFHVHMQRHWPWKVLKRFPDISINLLLSFWGIRYSRNHQNIPLFPCVHRRAVEGWSFHTHGD